MNPDQNDRSFKLTQEFWQRLPENENTIKENLHDAGAFTVKLVSILNDCLNGQAESFQAPSFEPLKKEEGEIIIIRIHYNFPSGKTEEENILHIEHDEADNSNFVVIKKFSNPNLVEFLETIDGLELV